MKIQRQSLFKDEELYCTLRKLEGDCQSVASKGATHTYSFSFFSVPPLFCESSRRLSTDAPERTSFSTPPR